MTLQQLRRARELTQVFMAKKLGISQDGVSKLEKRSDMLLSTLRKTVKALGGDLSLVAKFPDRAPVVLAGIVEDMVIRGDDTRLPAAVGIHSPPTRRTPTLRSPKRAVRVSRVPVPARA